LIGIGDFLVKSKALLILVFVFSLVLSVVSLAEPSLSGNAKLIYETIRWNLNLPKQTTVSRAEECIGTFKPDTPIHVLLMEVSVTPDLEMLYGESAKIILIDLDSGYVIDYANYDMNAMLVDGEVTDKNAVLHLLYGWYWMYLDGTNAGILDEDDEIILPVTQTEIDTINDALKTAFIR